MKTYYQPKIMPPSYDEVTEEEQEQKKKKSEKEDSCCKDCCQCFDECCCRPYGYLPGPYYYSNTPGAYALNCAIDCADSKASCTSCGCESCNCNGNGGGMNCSDPRACLIISAAIFAGGVVLGAASAAVYSVKEVVVAFNESCRSGTLKTVIGGAGAAAGWFASEALANYIAVQAGPNHHPEIIKPVVKGFCASLGSAATLFISKVKCSRVGLFSQSLREPLNPENPDLQHGTANQL